MLFYIICCLAATVIGAICGVGGGIIIRPALDAFSGLSVSEIGFFSGCTVLSMALVSFAAAGKEGDIAADMRHTVWLSGGAAAGGIIGKMLFDMLKAFLGADGMVSAAQNLILLVLTLLTFVYTLYKAKIHTKEIQSRGVKMLIGFVLGLASSFLSIGGGPFNLVALSYFLSMDSKTAARNSLYIILLSQFTSLLAAFFQGNIPVPLDWEVLAAMVISGGVGGYVGRRLTKRIGNRGTDRLFYILLAVIAGLCIYNILKSVG